eukprot:7951881-Prorocentrum_lima.AAC.1
MGSAHPQWRGRAHTPCSGCVGPLQSRFPTAATTPRADAAWRADPACGRLAMPAAHYGRPAEKS